MNKFGFYINGKLVDTCNAKNITEANQIGDERKTCNNVKICQMIGKGNQPKKTNIRFEIIHQVFND
jgi:hypothetical protein